MDTAYHIFFSSSSCTTVGTSGSAVSTVTEGLLLRILLPQPLCAHLSGGRLWIVSLGSIFGLPALHILTFVCPVMEKSPFSTSKVNCLQICWPLKYFLGEVLYREYLRNKSIKVIFLLQLR